MARCIGESKNLLRIAPGFLVVKPRPATIHTLGELEGLIATVRINKEEHPEKNTMDNNNQTSGPWNTAGETVGWMRTRNFADEFTGWKLNLKHYRLTMFSFYPVL